MRRYAEAWNVDSKRVVCDSSGDDAFPCFADLKCSPSENVFVTASVAAQPRGGVTAAPGGVTGGEVTRGQVTVWSLKVFRPMHVLPAAAAVHALAFNHNGKMLATAGADGMVRLYDLNARTQIMVRWCKLKPVLKSLVLRAFIFI